jgi:hypothetical protein
MARSGGVCGRGIASVSAVLVAGSRCRLRRRRARVGVEGMSGGCVATRRCSTAGQRVQGVLVVMARCVASVCPRRAHARRARRPGRHGRVLVSALSSSSSTRAGLGWRRRGGGTRWRRGQGWGSKGRGGGAAWPACGRHGHAMLALSPSLAPLCCI